MDEWTIDAALERLEQAELAPQWQGLASRFLAAVDRQELGHERIAFLASQIRCQSDFPLASQRLREWRILPC